MMHEPVSLAVVREPRDVDCFAQSPPYECLPPPPLEVLDEMPDDTPDDITLGEIYRSVSGLRTDLTAQLASLRQDVTARFAGIERTLDRVVYQDVFRAEIQTLNARIDAVASESMSRYAALESTVSSAKALAMWAVGLFAMTILAVVGAVLARLV